MQDTLFSVDRQVVLVSGGSRGIGRELARGFAERGATVIITGRDRKSLARTAKAISTPVSRVRSVVCDVAKPADIRRLVKGVLRGFRRIDTLINVAGVNRRMPVETYTVEDYDFILDINLRGAFLLSIEVGRHMLKRKRGSQINIDSLNTYAPLKYVAPYAMSKAGMSMMSRSLALEWGEKNVRVNGLAPGYILTDPTRKMWSQPKMKRWGVRNTPLRRLGEVEDLVGTAIFLASEASAFMTGQVLYVDGGFSAGTHWPVEL